jgi:NAD(P)-dependent dehydrogenase (short-subunit alcohol dehydrogenase family)
MSQSDERVVIITGGTGGLGSLVAPAFAHNGWQVALTDLDENSLAQHTQRLRNGESTGAVVGVKVDVTDAVQVAHFVASVEKVHGRVDALLNLVGGFAAGTAVGDLPDLGVWEKMWRLNVLSTVTMCHAVIPSLRRNGWGRIVNVGSRAAVSASAKAAAYSATKAAVVNLTEALAAEEKARNINVNVILPGTIDTVDNREAMPNADFSKWVPPQQIAETLLFLCSDAAHSITGATIAVYNRS